MSRLLAPVGLMAVVWVLSDQTDPNPAPDGLAGVTSQAAHVLVYGALLLAWRWALGGRTLLAAALAIGYGVVDELHQSTTPGRDATAVDVVFDAAGVALAAVAARWWSARRRAGRLSPASSS